MQEFNKVTTQSNFIKNLLHSTYLPLIRTVREDDYIIKDRIYVHKCKVIKCTNSGYIPHKDSNLDLSQKPKNDIAEYEILSEYYFGEKNGKLCTHFLSSSEGYDYKTHERLGKYLRCLRDMYGLNLMPLYNCFSNQPLQNIHIYNDKVSRTAEDFRTKVYKVPIRFNTTYTICMENLGMTTFAPAFIRHGTLLSLDNNRFGHGVDATNKYIKLHNGDVIYNKPNLRFKNPITIRFDNIPQNKVIHRSEYVDTEVLTKYDTELYEENSSASHLFIRNYKDDTYRVVDYNNPKLYPNPVYQKGYEYKADDGSSSETGIYPQEDNLFPNEELIPIGSYEGYYRSVNPSTGQFDEVNKSFKSCPDDETFFNENIFNNNKQKYYLYDNKNNVFTQCTSSSEYNPNEIYYYVNINTENGWYEKLLNLQTNEYEFIPTSDVYIDLDKVYYRKEKTEVPQTKNYDITEENCTMYDYIEDELYLLIQVPVVFDSNIVILEGDYTDTSKTKYYDDGKLELFSDARLDRLFINNLKLMKVGTKKIIPYSDTLIQYLLWHVICNLDSINNDMDRLLYQLNLSGETVTNYTGNYWFTKYREIVFNYANTFPKKYIQDNMGYVTTDIEDIIKCGPEYMEAKMEMEIIAQQGQDGPDE